MMMFKFDINTVVEPAVKNAKTFSGMITAEPVRKAVDSMIDANAAFTKSVFGAYQSYAESVAYQASK